MEQLSAICTDWQKQLDGKIGVCHMHAYWLGYGQKSNIKATEIDRIVAAEIPYPNLNKDLHEMRHMVHGHCGRRF